MTKDFNVFALEYPKEAETGHLPTQHLIGTADNKAAAINLCIKNGWTPFIEGEGGTIEQYDAQDAPQIYEKTANGLGAISVTVYASANGK